jgi:hypothetical protein
MCGKDGTAEVHATGDPPAPIVRLGVTVVVVVVERADTLIMTRFLA